MGLEVQFKGQTYSASIQKGVLTVIVTEKLTAEGQELSLDFAGVKTADGKHEKVKALSELLKIGDEITIRVK